MKPVILLNASFSEKKLSLGTDYFDCVSRAGGTPLILPPDRTAIEDALKLAGGVLLVGGPDYDPHRYAGKKLDSHRPIDPRREEFDLALARAAARDHLPILGICGGAQLLCLSLGGTLVEHIPEEFDRPLWHADSKRQEIAVEPGTLLASVIGEGRHTVNSYHHQSVREPGEGMCVSARAPDGVVECIEPAEGKWFALGVQWHPERMPGAPEAEALFGTFVERATGVDRRRKKPCK